MKVSNVFFHWFAIVFFIFAILFISFQNYGMTGEEGGSRFWLMRVTLLLDVVCLIMCLLRLNRSYSGVHLVCMLWLLIMPVIMFVNNAPMADTVRTILWPLLFEATYLSCRGAVYRGDFLKRMFFVLAIIGAVYFFMTRFGVAHQTNTIYFCFLTMPWMMYKADRRTMGIIVLTFTVLALMSLKRSTMLTMVLLWGFYFLNGMRTRRNKIYTLIASLALVVGVYLAYDKIDEYTGGVLTERVNKEETDEGKGREAIWQITTLMIQQSSPGKLITGHGHFGVRRDSFLEISAHNDFLEVIYDYGLIIFFLYLCLWGYVVRRAYKLYRIRSSIFLPYAASLSIFLVMSMVSHLILYTTYFNYLVMFWGFTEAYVESCHPELYTRKRIRSV